MKDHLRSVNPGSDPFCPRILPDFDRLYLRAQVDFFDNFVCFGKLRPRSLRYADLDGILFNL